MSQKKGFVIPLIEDIVNFCKDKVKLDIELKEIGYEEEIVSLVKGYLDYSDYIIKSFHARSIKAIKKIESNIITGLLLGKSDPQTCMTRLSELFL